MGSPLYYFFQTRGSLAPVFLRWVLAVIFGYHGSQKVFGWFGGKGFAETVAEMSSPDTLAIPAWLAVLAILAELSASLLLFVGFGTRLAAFLLVGIMTGAITLVHGEGTFLHVEYPLLILAAALSLLFSGGGLFSIDRKIADQLLPPQGFLF